MIEGINKPQFKDKVAVVAIGYNRKGALSRLLDSLNSANYSTEDIPLVISIDSSGDTDFYEFVRSFEWKHGEKIVNIQEKRLGLKTHILQCFSLSEFFKGVIILEDDLFVSPSFYKYATEALDYYGDVEQVAGIALYKNEYNGFHGLPIQFLNSGYDVFAWQSVCSWGEALNYRMWKNFSKWLETFDDDFQPYDMCETIIGWTRAWSKYMYAYMLDTNKTFIYPYQPVTTNFNDAGGEHGGGGSIVQVNLMQGERNYHFGKFESLEQYDIYGNNKAIASWLDIEEENLTIDFYGDRRYYKGRYILSPCNLPYNRKQSFRLTMRPWELNIKYGIKGEDIILYERGTSNKTLPPKRALSYKLVDYFLTRHQRFISLRCVMSRLFYKCKKKIWR